ncbi:MAG: PepSY domain-containing protein [Chromatiaceae bacterium]|nr:PepSY domain-containing protein [Chromatiaceae bacterium]
MNRKTQFAIAAALLIGATVGAAYALVAEQNDALGISEAKVSLAQAIAAAEHDVGGRASRAEFEREPGKGLFQVEVVNGQTVMDVTVDASNGEVLSAVLDRFDGLGDDDDRIDHEKAD